MTMEYNGFDDSATIMDPEHFNQVTAKDCGKLLEDINRRTWVSRGISNEIEDIDVYKRQVRKTPEIYFVGNSISSTLSLIHILPSS